MHRSLFIASAVLLALSACGDGNQQSISVGSGVNAGNISQSQSGWSNSQSMSIGSTDSEPAAAKKGGKTLSSSQVDTETGNSQSARVTGSAKVAQSQGGGNNTQSAVVDGSGNISQSQSGNSNSQSLVIGGNSSGGTPSIRQSQTGSNRTQSIKIDGKKVETKE